MTNKKKTQLKTIILSDIDGTLVRGSLVLRHAVFLHKNGICDMGDHARAWMRDQKNESLITALAETYREAIIGFTVEDLRVAEFIDDIVSDSDNFYSTLDTLVEHHHDGAPVLLISGSPEFLVESFADAFGFEHSASFYARDELGRFTGDCIGMFSGDAKRKFIAALDLSGYDRILAFGDTQSDAPLFERAHHSTLVEPSSVTREALRHLVQSIVLA